ncbi:prealbumin-like fold domain-containing protein [Nitrososphaera viennensis]|uniref:prealbumin-like fold domain-containing protein n=1 Tax=Nitrososphaera viennensis TaxID=1034015 RepID=UPI0009FEFF44|nr:prealbumin-like fold domain-containing protein [Nitrososphaera viennensis]
MSPKQSLALAIALAAAVTIAAIAVSLPREQNSPGAAQDGGGKGAGSITIVTISKGLLLTGATYSITPSPYTGEGTYSVQDGGRDDANPAAGMIVLTGVKNGNYTVLQQQAPAGYDRDQNPKVIAVSDNNNNSSATATFSNAAPGLSGNDDNSTLQVHSILYTAKFECGTISGGEGPLRPGHYDTDIGILNKQDFPVKFTWNAVVNNGKTTNSILKTLEPQSSTGIVCNDLRKLFGGNNDNRFVEGFVIVNVPVDSGLLGTLSGGTAVVGRQGTSIDMLDVQVFYTANALEQLPHEVLVDKIVFTVTNDTSGKIPGELVGKKLDVTVRSGFGEISDPVEKVKQALAEKYGLDAQERASLAVKVDSISVGAGTMIDDHALSLSRVPPQASSSSS